MPILLLNMFNNPIERVLLASLGAIYLFKAVVLAARRGPRTAAGLATFLFAWPGVFPDCFRERHPGQTIEPAAFLAAWARLGLGALSIVLLAIYVPYIPEPVLGLAGIAALLLTIHLGIGDLLPWLLRWVGFVVPPVFDRPWAARSLTEFWGTRWNLPFVEINRRFFLRPLHRYFSGRLHASPSSNSQVCCMRWGSAIRRPEVGDCRSHISCYKVRWWIWRSDSESPTACGPGSGCWLPRLGFFMNHSGAP